MHYLLSWPVRLLVVGLLILSIAVDGAGYIQRILNHQPLTGQVSGMPPQLLGNQVYIHRGLDLQGGTDLLLQITDVPPGRDMNQVQRDTIDVISKRINKLGVSEPVINPVGRDRIEVQLAGVSAAKAQATIGNTARLVTTKWVADANVKGGPFPGSRPQITPLTSEMLTGADASLDPQNGNQWVINVTYNSQGAAIFSQLSTEAFNATCPNGATDCPQHRITNWLNLTQDDIVHWDERAAQLTLPFDQGGKLLVDARIIQPITGGQSQITGNFTADSAKNLAILLNSGALPGNLQVIQSTEVGATLGADSIKRSLAAGVLGLLIVIVFMIFFYRLPGLVASVALLFYAGLTLAVFKMIPVTLTLAGLAGFILSVGMAVDANVLIFERFKEEVRSGVSVGAAVETAVGRAWPAIRDSNTATLITTGLLYLAGNGPVKGFAITLFLGVLVSMFSSIIVTHNLMALVVENHNAEHSFLMGVTLPLRRGRA
ncbi:MAG: protein translocase subunit SecD [Candidatus Dormibacteraeota bacterium]|uniref:Protein translocase subunit SecD n=1 Tax=Candidatus Dormiibacter inghamiae TaxID=3127013 RepID=A0A934KDP1_9BACT|nr:protein translocase subunit SecD [Candidatus Dormibacteraeota bacterium]MBJ7607449.1 protein translocase subunit SecD [Candidatus Dormibacteraeota bacterium]